MVVWEVTEPLQVEISNLLLSLPKRITLLLCNRVFQVLENASKNVLLQLILPHMNTR